MSKLYDEIRRIATQAGVELDHTDVYRVASTVMFAAGDRNPQTILQLEMKRLIEQIQRNAEERKAPEPPPKDAAATFSKIDNSLQNGTCPRCSKKMRDVKLADYTPARICPGDCRIVLWIDDSTEDTTGK